MSPAPTPLAKDEAEDFADEMVEVRRKNRAFISVIITGAIAYLVGLKAKCAQKNHGLIWISKGGLDVSLHRSNCSFHEAILMYEVARGVRASWVLNH